MKWLYKLDYKFGKYYIRHLMTIIIAGMAAVYIGDIMLPNINLTGLLSLDRTAILQNLQLWRLITFLFIPTGSGFLTFIALYFYWLMGTSLENVWGGFRFNIYYLLGWLGAIIAMFITGSASNTFLNLSLFLGFATVSPDFTVRLFFILPIKAKWLAIGYGAFAVLNVLQAFIGGPMYQYGYYLPGGPHWDAGIAALVTLGFSLVNYLLFFGGKLLSDIKVWNQRRAWRRQNRR